MKLKLFAAAAAALIAVASAGEAEACSRILYKGTDSLMIVGRSLDWKTPIPTNIYVYPRGMEKKGHDKLGAVSWTSKYGAVYAVGYDGGVTEGMNEEGLVVNGLFCKGSVYSNEKNDDRAPMSLAMFVAWMLDLNATTDECVAALRRQPFTISGKTFDGGTVSALHWGITDRSGKTAIVEFVGGDIHIYESDSIIALTNDPTYPDMMAINAYWEKKGGIHTLPGTVSSPDRFVRGTFFDKNVKHTGDPDLGLSIIRSILFNVSVPYTYEVKGEGNLSSTQWRSFANLRDLRYYFDIVTNPGIFYVDLSKCDLRKGAPVMKIDTSKTSDFVGDETARLFPTTPFKPMY